MFNQSSIQTKILLSIFTVFLLLMFVSLAYMENRQKQIVQELATERAHDFAKAYLDGINTMMLTGSMTQKEILRDKTLTHKGVSEIRLIRSKVITDVYGVGNSEQKPVDAWDDKALNGETITYQQISSKGRELTIIDPILASANFNGTNCLSCHPVKEGTVLGAVRINYSLADLDNKINHDLLTNALISLSLFCIGMFLLTIGMKKIVVLPLSLMRDKLKIITLESDLSQRMTINSNDEIGQVNASFNTMLANFANSLTEVYETSHQLASASTQIANVSRKTTEAAKQQNIET